MPFSTFKKQNKNKNPHTIVACRSKRKKHVVVVSTIQDDDSFDVEEPKRHQIVISYNAAEGGVDSMGQMCHPFNTTKKDL